MTHPCHNFNGGLTPHPLVPHIPVNWANISSGNGLSPVRRQAITWTNAHLLPIGPLRTNLSEIWIEIKKFIHQNAFETVGDVAAIL